MLELIPLILLITPACVAIFLLQRLAIARIRYKIDPASTKPLPADKLPSVTVCIPARNETHAMTRCLEAIIASDYPKLEIIVLDDASVDNTSFLIKSFAHAGVRFIKGPTLPAGWMGRNFAYQNLLGAASGRYIFFMSVDTHIEPATISRLISHLRAKKAEMLSILPIRLDNPRLSVFFSTLRYLNELIFTDRNSPPVSSAAWIVNRELLKNLAGDLSDYRDDVRIESNISKLFASRGEYTFLVSPRISGVSYEKHWLSQIETSIRTYALATRGNLLRQFSYCAIFVSYLIPFALLVYSIFFPNPIIITAATSVALAFCVAFFAYVRLVWSRFTILALPLFPIIALQELAIFCVAIYKRHFGRITWKGRDIYSTKTPPN